MIEDSHVLTGARLEPGTSRDLGGVMAIMEAAFDPRFGEAWTRSQCAGILPMHGVTLTIARIAGSDRAVGFSLYRTVSDEAELLLLAVDPAHRHQGVGRLLLEDFMESARDYGAGRVHLEVREGNAAMRMYRSAGFVAVGRRYKYYRGSDGTQFDALTLARQLWP